MPSQTCEKAEKRKRAHSRALSLSNPSNLTHSANTNGTTVTGDTTPCRESNLGCRRGVHVFTRVARVMVSQERAMISQRRAMRRPIFQFFGVSVREKISTRPFRVLALRDPSELCLFVRSQICGWCDFWAELCGELNQTSVTYCCGILTLPFECRFACNTNLSSSCRTT